jgi:hypothetical protein
MSSLMRALEQFEVVEANLVKVERLWEELRSLFPVGLDMSDDYPDYDNRQQQFEIIIATLPKIDGWEPKVSVPSPLGIGQARLDWLEIDEPLAASQWESGLWESGAKIRRYRFLFNQKRRALIRDALVEAMDQVDADLCAVRQAVGNPEPAAKLASPLWEQLRDHADQIEVLLGSDQKPPRWRDFRRHLAFGQGADLTDIEQHDWPAIKDGIRKNLYGVNEPLAVEVADLADIVMAKPRGSVTMALRWSQLDDDHFERLLFALFSREPGYENPEWLMRTRAPDRGRDLSVTRVIVDGLSGTTRQRVIIQCKHWLTKSIALPDASLAMEQTKLWPDPRVDVLVIATSGRFTSDAVQWIERHNASANSPRIEMWPESHLERLLAARPPLIAEFHLR